MSSGLSALLSVCHISPSDMMIRVSTDASISLPLRIGRLVAVIVQSPIRMVELWRSFFKLYFGGLEGIRAGAGSGRSLMADVDQAESHRIAIW